MNTRKHWTQHATWLTAAFTLTASSSCSLLYDFNTTQCKSTPDCHALGFENTACVYGACVVQNVTAGTGGSNGSGGASNPGGQSSTVSSAATGGGQPQGGSGGVSATGGAGGQAECITNADCIKVHVGQPYICKIGTCVKLTDNVNCPVIIPAKTAQALLENTNAAPIVIGAFASMGNPSDLHETQAVINWDLAFDQFNTSTLGGLNGFNGGPARPFIGLVCQGATVAGSPPDIATSMAHLTQDVQVTAVLSTLSANNLLTAWNYTDAKTSQSVFFMNTGSASLQLVNTQNNGLMWHMLGDPHILAATTVALLKQIEPYVNAQRKAYYLAAVAAGTAAIDNPDTVPLRVTLIHSTHPTMADMYSVLTTTDSKHPETLLKFNGKTILENGTDFHSAEIDSASTVATPDVTAGITEIQTNPSHIILAMATSEFPNNVIPQIETNWGTVNASNTVGIMRPYYIMSHLIYNGLQLRNMAASFSAKTPPINTRIVGVNYGSAQDDHSKGLYGDYFVKLQGTYPIPPGTLSISGTENYYDGAYYLLYSIAAAAKNRANPSSLEILAGLENRVINTSSGATPVDVGPGVPMQTAISNLFTNSSYAMTLWGTMGYPNFNILTGSRISPTSAWCIQQNTAVTPPWDYQADGLIYNPVAPNAGTFSPNSAGVPTCLQSYCDMSAADAGTTICPVK